MDLIDRWQAIERINDENIEAHMDSVMDGELHRVKRAVQRIVASMPSAEKPNKWLFINENNEPKFWEYNIRKGQISPITDLEDTSITWTAGIPFAEKTGRWLSTWHKDEVVCSNCRRYWVLATDVYDFKYCPSCGARMEG